jgi:sporulation protein YtfJ
MNSIKDMIDVNTIIGDPIQTSNNIVVIPISKVSFGFAAGGSEFKGETIDEYKKRDKEESIQYRLPFGGGSGAGVTINPIAFLIVQPNNVKLLPVNHSSCFDKILDYIPDLIDKTNNMMNKCVQTKKETTEQIIKEMKKNNSRGEEKKKEVVKTKKEPIKPRKDETYEFEYDETNNQENNDYEEYDD